MRPGSEPLDRYREAGLDVVAGDDRGLGTVDVPALLGLGVPTDGTEVSAGELTRMGTAIVAIPMTTAATTLMIVHFVCLRVSSLPAWRWRRRYGADHGLGGGADRGEDAADGVGLDDPVQGEGRGPWPSPPCPEEEASTVAGGPAITASDQWRRVAVARRLRPDAAAACGVQKARLAATGAVENGQRDAATLLPWRAVGDSRCSRRGEYDCSGGACRR